MRRRHLQPLRLVNQANAYLAVRITAAVGTMWCAYAFTGLALVSLPDAIRQGRAATVSWIAQTFLQLVLLSVIIVGQNILAKAQEKRAAEDHLRLITVLNQQNKVLRDLAQLMDELRRMHGEVHEHFGIIAET